MVYFGAAWILMPMVESAPKSQKFWFFSFEYFIEKLKREYTKPEPQKMPLAQVPFRGFRGKMHNDS